MKFEPLLPSNVIKNTVIKYMHLCKDTAIGIFLSFCYRTEEDIKSMLASMNRQFEVTFLNS